MLAVKSIAFGKGLHDIMLEGKEIHVQPTIVGSVYITFKERQLREGCDVHGDSYRFL